MVGLPCLVSQYVKLHVSGWTWAVFTSVYVDSCTWPVAIFTIDERKEQRVSIRFCANLRKRATETLTMIQQIFRDQILSRTLVFQWHVCITVKNSTPLLLSPWKQINKVEFPGQPASKSSLVSDKYSSRFCASYKISFLWFESLFLKRSLEERQYEMNTAGCLLFRRFGRRSTKGTVCELYRIYCSSSGNWNIDEERGKQGWPQGG
jgi:hypothetical protein